MTKPASKRYSPEVRERTVRMVREHRADHAFQWEAISSIAAKIGCSGERLRKWVQQAERDQGAPNGLRETLLVSHDGSALQPRPIQREAAYC